MKLLGALLILVTCACGVPAEQVYEVSGVVRAIDLSERQLKIAHQDIPGFMPAMTMSFDVADDVDLDALAPGAEIRFELERSATLLKILSIEVLAPGDPEARAARPLVAIGAGPEPAPDFELVDQDGEPFALRDLLGRRVMLDFVFTRCPGPCPMLTTAHVNVQKRLSERARSDTHFVSISLDPEYDTPERMREYALARGADLSHWSFVTGPPDVVDAVIQSYHVGRVRNPEGELDHLVVTFLIDRAGLIQKRFVGLDHETADLLRGLETLP